MRCSWTKVFLFAWVMLALVAGCAPPASITAVPSLSGNVTMPPPPTVTSSPGSGLGPGGNELPPLPDFQEILSFGGGGGGDPGCIHDPGTSPALTIEPEDFRLADNYIDLCLWGVVKPGMSFRVSLTSPDGRTFRSNTLSEDREANFKWDGYPDPVYQDFAVAHFAALSRAVSVAVSWPANMPEGTWHATATVGSTELTAKASITRAGKPSISAIPPDLGTEALPVGIENVLTVHPLPLQDSAHIDVYGVNYPANARVYVLLYQTIPPGPEAPHQLKLIHQQAVFADANGTVVAAIPGAFVTGSSYLIMGIGDSSTSPDFAPQQTYFLGDAPYDYFIVERSSVSCPGAPPQRMLVGQQGRVCTQSDAVRLHALASQSSGVVARLPSRSLFTVIAGPACADSSSWWQIKTSDGTVGWLSEGGDQTDPYFICPLP